MKLVRACNLFLEGGNLEYLWSMKEEEGRIEKE